MVSLLGCSVSIHPTSAPDAASIQAVSQGRMIVRPGLPQTGSKGGGRRTIHSLINFGFSRTAFCKNFASQCGCRSVRKASTLSGTSWIIRFTAWRFSGATSPFPASWHSGSWCPAAISAFRSSDARR
jgi:hypothetical protein